MTPRSSALSLSPSRRAVSPTSAASARSYAFKTNGKNDDRCGYIRATHQPNDLYYDLPGISDDVKKAKIKGPSFATMSGDRYQHHAAAKAHASAPYYDLPGMADIAASKRRGPDFNRSPPRQLDGSVGVGLRTSPAKKHASPTRSQINDISYDVPAFTDELARSTKGSAAFRMTSPRLSYIPRPTAGHDVPLRSATGTIAHETSPLRKASDASCASFRYTADRFKSPTKKSGEAFTVAAYDIPGMAETVLKSPRGSASFRSTTSGRDSHIKAFPKFSDLSYDIPGMGERQQSYSSLAGSPGYLSRRNSMSLGATVLSVAVPSSESGDSLKRGSTPTRRSAAGYLSPTRSSLARDLLRA
eukprot:CAMPEP_0176429582 /NCGR_PEP_ID=MMETSP0127-20121128/13789_1 /TAXON_ID=938130 /ORGANISM="Platyophrya macrostoma, Strain WH" /LENGTH=357 /DNA_ID=CAMNT_0017811399 /DNA_START=109 /DNA_END=1182 /DNA_ORIENTATION=+